MPENCSRIVFVAKDECRIETFSLPDTLGPNEVLIDTIASLVSPGTELAVLRKTHRSFATGGPRAEVFKYPFLPGYASVGRVVAVGWEVTGLSEGDVVWHPGTHATAAIASAEECRLVPAGVAPEDAVFLTLVEIAITAIYRAPARLGERVLVSGMGIVGTLCAELYRLTGGRVAAAEFSPGRLERSRRLGFDPVIDLTRHSLEDWYAENPELAPSLVVEAAGVGANIVSCMRSAAKNGRVVLLGSPRDTVEIDPYTDIHIKGLSIIGAHAPTVGRDVRESEAGYVFELCAGPLRLSEMRTHVVPFSRAVEMYDRLESELDEYLGVVLTY